MFHVCSFCIACGGDQKESQGGSGISDTGVAPEAELVIKGTNFQFDQEEYRLKKGVPVKITYENEDGNHGVMIPALGLRLDRKTTPLSLRRMRRENSKFRVPLCVERVTAK